MNKYDSIRHGDSNEPITATQNINRHMDFFGITEEQAIKLIKGYLDEQNNS